MIRICRDRERGEAAYITFFTEADHERVSPRKMMKKKGPQRSQSLSAFPGSSRKGLGNTTSLRLLTIRDRSRFTVSHTGSVSVFGTDPKPSAPIPPWSLPPGGTAAAADATLTPSDGGGSGGAPAVAGLAGRKGGGAGEEETGMEARGGEGGRAGRTVAEGAALMRLSISSMSDWEEGWRGMVSPWDIVVGGGGARVPARDLGFRRGGGKEI